MGTTPLEQSQSTGIPCIESVIPEGVDKSFVKKSAVRVDGPLEALATPKVLRSSTAKRACRVSETLSAEQRAALTERGVPKERITRIAKMPTAERRQACVNLIASGMDIDSAICLDGLPANTTSEIVNSPNADGYKPEAQMTDDEWFVAYCGEKVRRIPNFATYKASAILYRHTRVARVEFRSQTHKLLKEIKGNDRTPFYYLLNRLTNVAHPNDWLHCGQCGGTGAIGRDQCGNCRGNGFIIKTDF